MALTVLDDNTALIVVDLQVGVAGMVPAAALAPVVERAVALIGAFRAQGLPVVLVNVAGSAPGRTEAGRHSGPLPDGFVDLLPELNRQASDIVVTKYTAGAFATTDLEARLKALGVTQVVICGVATGSGVEATARQAHEAGFNVTLAIDAMMDPRAEAHAYSTEKLFPRLGETGLVGDVIDLLTQRTQ
ncbi:isochorismatase family protein [Neorhizobium sp. NCHU2750]|uniref:cysteine hydrolase family protein n=1 Tax=Neorhizobium sp. NCHU2750 TaxID=1825976 RepID=UPI000E74B069|nr:hydrolase [Neorhizobium sp. NCHU2750]